MRFRIPPIAVLNLSLAGLVLATGLPGISATVMRLPSEVTIRALEANQPTDRVATEIAAARLEDASAFSNAARADLALALLAGAGEPNAIGARVAADHAARELRTYLAAAPDDSFAWANLAMAEVRRRTPGAAVQPFKMSIELAPPSAANLLWRCGFGADLYPFLDTDGKALLARQFRDAMDSADPDLARQLVALMKQKNILPLARQLIAGDDGAAERFDRLAAFEP